MIQKTILFVKKPPGPTSHDIVDEVRRITGEKRVGHAGTLDPFAQGLLIVLVGREATRRQSEFMKLDKEYIATLHLGAESNTGDLTGTISSTRASEINLEPIGKALQKFVGEISQVPPEFSAIKINGKKAYELARAGKEVKLEARKIKIYGIEVINYKWPSLELKINCSSGTYIRALARDIGRELECGAYLEKLVRTKIGEYKLENAINLSQI